MSPTVARRATIDLFAWLTLANGDETGFADAADPGGRRASSTAKQVEVPGAGDAADQPQLLAAGHDQRHRRGESMPTLRRRRRADRHRRRPPSPNAARTIVVRLTIAMRREQEELGDLKLYRIPERGHASPPAPRSRWRCSTQPAVKVETVYRHGSAGERRS